MNVKCPTCGKSTKLDPANHFRPFCSERCQTLDLGAWAEEKYRVPIEGDSSGVNKNSDDESGEDDEMSSQRPLH